MIRILFEDQHLVVLSKPAGLLSQGGALSSWSAPGGRGAAPEDHLVARLQKHFGRNYVGLVHRLDRNTSGLMVVAKRSKSADRLTQALQEGRIDRRYLAWVAGKLLDADVWEHRLEKDEQTNTVRVVSPPAGKIARLKVIPQRFIEAGPSTVTLVEFRLETGRSHQIRIQSATEDHPLLGDTRYGKKDWIKRATPRLALHSHWISFPHPMSEEQLTFTDPLPKDIAEPRVLI